MRVLNIGSLNIDYVYTVEALADLRGKKLQKKRNHVNRFRTEHPDYRVEEIRCENIVRVQHMINDWYVNRRRWDPQGDYLLESLAMAKAFRCYDALGMEGIALLDGDRVLVQHRSPQQRYSSSGTKGNVRAIWRSDSRTRCTRILFSVLSFSISCSVLLFYRNGYCLSKGRNRAKKRNGQLTPIA